MQDKQYKKVIYDLPYAFAYIKVIVDGSGIPVDYEFLEVNPAFEHFFDLDADKLYGQKASTLELPTLDAKFDWLDIYADVTLEKEKNKEVEFYIGPLKRWFQAKIYAPEKQHIVCTITDITDWKEKEQVQADTLQQIRTLAQDLPILICSFLPDSTLTYVNQAYAEYFSSTPEKLRGKRFFDFLPQEVAQNLLNAYQQLTPEHPIHISEHPVHRGAQIMWHKWIDKAYFDKAGNVIEYQAVGLDITAQRETERLLRASEANFRLLFENSPIGTYIVHRDGTFLDANPRFLEHMGAPSIEDIRERSNVLTFPLLQEIGVSKLFQRCIDTKEVQRKESFYKSSWGKEIYLSMYIFPLLDKNGEVEKMYGIVEDIMERKAAEKALEESELNFRLLFEHSPVGIFIVHRDGSILDANPASLELIGAPSLAEMQKRTNVLTFPPLVNAGLSKVFHECLATKELQHDESYYKTSWGKEIYFHSYIFPVLDKDGEVEKMYALVENVIERKQYETELKQAKIEAERASNVKSEFLAGMSHEIRTPLNGVIGFTNLLSSTKLDETQQEYIDSANTSAHTLLEIINDILDFSKIEAGKLELEIRESNLLELIEQATNSVKYQASVKDVELIVDVAASVPSQAQVDPTRLKQILMNLLSNAVKFTEKGSVKLKLTFQEKSKHLGLFTFRVQDTGIGIDENQQKKLFQAFSQADRSTNRRFGGTGLGLVISQSIAHQMGSRIDIESEVGKGTTFFFTIEVPYKSISNKKEEAFQNPKLRAALSELEVTLVVAEDNAVNMLLADKILRNLMPNVTLINAKTGKEAMEYAQQSKPNLILMDVQMPEMNGITASKHIRIWEQKNSYLPIPIIALTANASTAERDRCIAAGMNDFMTKPFDRKILLDILEKYLLND